MKKCIFTLLLALLLVIGLLPMTARAGELDNGLQYEIYSSSDWSYKYVVITRYSGNATNVVIPAQIEDFPVTSIGQAAFRDCSNLTEIVLPDSLTSIRDSAFSGCSNLVSIDLPDNLTSIGKWAFNGCTNLSSIDFASSLNSMGESAFRNCSSLTNIVLPNTLLSISES